MLEMFYRGEINLSTQCKIPLKQTTFISSVYMPIFKRLSNALEKKLNLFENCRNPYCITTATVTTITVCSVLNG